MSNFKASCLPSSFVSGKGLNLLLGSPNKVVDLNDIADIISGVEKHQLGMDRWGLLRLRLNLEDLFLQGGHSRNLPPPGFPREPQVTRPLSPSDISDSKNAPMTELLWLPRHKPRGFRQGVEMVHRKKTPNP